VLVSVQASRLQDPGAGGNRRTIVYWGLPPAAASFGGHHREMERWLDRHAVDRIVFSHVTSDGLQMADLLRIFGDTAPPVVCAPDWAQATMHVTVDQVGSSPASTSGAAASSFPTASYSGALICWFPAPVYC